MKRNIDAYFGFERWMCLPSCSDMVCDKPAHLYEIPDQMKEPITMLQRGIEPANITFGMIAWLGDEVKKIV